MVYSARPALAAVICVCAAAAWAQAPDAGRLLRENAPLPAPPRLPPPLNIQVQPSVAVPGVSEVQVSVNALRIEGLSRLDPTAIAAQVTPPVGTRLDLNGLRAIAVQVEMRVRASGLPFARAYLPPQDLANGELVVAVVEGRYGQVNTAGEAANAARAWLGPLRSGQPITSAVLERSLLLLGDLPGVQAQALLRPGAEVGTGDLEVQVDGTRRLLGEVGFDNHGNRYAGRERLRAGLDVEQLLMFGDQLNLRGSISREGTWLASVAYSHPLGNNGLRAQWGVSRTDYQLGKEFQSLGARGTADTLSGGVTYPLLRTQSNNVRVSGALEYKRLHDTREAADISERKRSLSLPVTLSGDARDGTGVTYGSAALSFGRLTLDGSQKVADATSANTDGRFEKLNIDLVRLQTLNTEWALYARVSAQKASKNLDSSEKFVLGGATAVRAWPSGEATGDEGVLGQLELRYRAATFEPFLFVDAGSVRVNRKPFGSGDNKRSIAGPGIGLRWATGPWAAEGTVAWRNGSDKPASEPGAGRPQTWLTVSYRF